MRKTKLSFTARYAVLAVAAVVVGAFSMYGGVDFSKSLKTAVVGSYGYTTSPINYTARNFACYPGPVQPNDGTKYAGTYNTYMHNYAESYANSGVKGTWCTNYIPSITQDPGLYDDPPLKTSTTNTPTDHTTAYISGGVYKVTDANGNEDTTNTIYRRWQYHKNAAQIHENKVVFYKETLAGYGTVYKTGSSSGGSTTADATSGLYGYAIVHCPDGAVVVDHTNTASQYKATQSGRHYLSSPTDENGLYDGSGHYWCELNGVAVNPVVGPETGKSVPDYTMTDRDKLFKFEFPDGTKKYKSYIDSSNTSSSGFVKCADGSSVVGPFTGASQYTNQYWVKEAGKRDYYRCYDNSKGLFTNAVTDSTALASPYNSILFSYFKTDNVKSCDSTYATCQPSCAAGDATCGGAGTYGPTTQGCASNTYWCQTTDVNYRYCSADSTCTSAEMTPPAPSWTINAPTNLRITGTKTTGFSLTESVPVAADFAATGTGIPYGQATLTVQIAQDTSFATTWIRPSSTGAVTAVGSPVNSYIDNFPATGTFYWRAKMSLGAQESAWTSSPYGSFVVCSTGKTWNGTSCVTPVVATCSLGLTLNDNKTTYNKSDFVNYTYTCSPVGTKAANVTVQVVKPDGTAVTYNSGTNIDTATMGFGASNLNAGVHTLRACLDSACTTGVASVNFTVVDETTTTTTGPTLNGTIFKDGQYVDPATSTLRNCVSPNYWMKETATSSGARGFHCMPNTPGYTLTSDHYPPTPCTGTLWAGGSSTTITFSSDYCATSKDSSVTPPPPPGPKTCTVGEICPKDSWCNNGSRCHYPDGTLTCTSSWGDSCPAGTKVCSPTDTNCREPGSITPVVENAWCSNSMSCYSKDGKELFCQLSPVLSGTFVPAATTMSCSDPKYPSSCRPGDKYCTEIGATNSNAGAWCSGGGKQCYKGTDLLCVGFSESCPADTGACKASDVANGCTEPGKYGTGSNAWCGGGGSVQCHKNDGTGIYCGQLAGGSMDPTAWETFSCPSDTSRCRKDDKYCLGAIGSKGPSGSWCAVGMSKSEIDGTVTCVSSKDYMIDRPVVPPVVDECVRVTTIAFDPSTNNCKQFATTCNVPAGWTMVTDGRVCKDGKLTSIDLLIGGDDQSLKDVIEGYRLRIREYDLQLNKLPPQVQSKAEVAAVTVLVTDSGKLLKDLLQKFPTRSEADKQYLKDKIGAFNKDTFVGIESRMRELAPYMDFASLKDELRRDLEKYKIELDKIKDKDSEYYQKVSSMAEKLADLLDSAENQTGAALEQLLVAIKDTRNQLETLVKEQRRDNTGNFLQETINNLIADEARFSAFVERSFIDDSKVSYLFKRFSGMIEKIRTENTGGESTKVLLGLVNDAQAMRDRLMGWLEGYGLERIDEPDDVSSVVKSYVDEAVAKRIEEMFGGLKDSLSLMLDEALQPLVLKVAELSDKMRTLSDGVAQSVNNLQYVVEKHREDIIEAKTRIIEQVEGLKAALTASNLGNFTVQGMNDVVDTVAQTTWCGAMAETVESRMNTAGLAIEGDEFETSEFNDLKANVERWRTVDNPRACYDGGYTPGWDVPMHEWYFGPVQDNVTKGWVNGYKDAQGNFLGQIGPGDPALRIEGLKMMMNLFGVAKGGFENPPVGKATSVPNWPNANGQNEANAYVNGALEAGVDLVKYGALDQPITRAQTAGLIYDVMVASGANYFAPADTFTHVKEYNDAEKVLANKEFSRVIESLTDMGVFKGSSATGNLDPNNSLVRSEFATLNQRLDQTWGLSEAK